MGTYEDWCNFPERRLGEFRHALGEFYLETTP